MYKDLVFPRRPKTPPTRSLQFLRLVHPGSISNALFSADGRRLLTICTNVDGYPACAYVWDSLSGKKVGELPPQEGRVLEADFSADGKQVVARMDGMVRILDSETARPMGEPIHDEMGIYSAGFSPDGTKIIITNSKGAQIWVVATHTRWGKLMKPDFLIGNAMFSPDGRFVLLSDSDSHTQKDGSAPF